MRYWPVVCGIIFVALALTLGILADSVPALQRLLILFFMILTLHEFEEYVYPGGFLWVFSVVSFFYGETIPISVVATAVFCIFE